MGECVCSSKSNVLCIKSLRDVGQKTKSSRNGLKVQTLIQCIGAAMIKRREKKGGASVANRMSHVVYLRENSSCLRSIARKKVSGIRRGCSMMKESRISVEREFFGRKIGNGWQSRE